MPTEEKPKFSINDIVLVPILGTEHAMATVVWKVVGHRWSDIDNSHVYDVRSGSWFRKDVYEEDIVRDKLV